MSSIKVKDSNGWKRVGIPTNFNADTVDGKHADEFATTEDIRETNEKLNEIIGDIVYSDENNETDVSVPLNADTLGGHPASDFALTNDLKNLKASDVGAATEAFVTNKIAEAQLSGGGSGDIDLSDYATKDDLAKIDYPVDSVNGKTGAVQLSASDVDALPISGGNLTGKLTVGDKLEFWKDAEGGNIRIIPKDGAVADYWDVDANGNYGEGLRFYASKNEDNPNGEGLVFPLTLHTDGSIEVGSASKTRERLGITPANIGAVPTSRTVNGKALSSNISLSASDVGAEPAGLVSESYSAASNNEIDTVIQSVYSSMSNSTVKHIVLHVSATGIHLYGGQNHITIYKTNNEFGMVEALNYTNNTLNRIVRAMNNGSWSSWEDASHYNYLPITGGTLTGKLTVGNKVDIWTDTEGGNVRIVPSESGKTYTNYWEIDSYDGGLRFYAHRPSTNPNGTGVIQTLVLGTDGSIKTANSDKTRKNLGVAPATQSTASPNCYYRTVDGVTEWINPPMNVGTEYRTTERYLGKVVYTRLLDLGSLPANTEKAYSSVLSTSCYLISMDAYAVGDQSSSHAFIPLAAHKGVDFIYYNRASGGFNIKTNTTFSNIGHVYVLAKYYK